MVYVEEMEAGRRMMEHEYSKTEKQYGIRVGTGAPPVEHDPDSVESLLQQVFSQALDNKDALGNMRHALLGPWPEPAPDHLSKSIPSSGGMIAQLKDTLYRIMEVQREIREHVVAISKGVR